MPLACVALTAFGEIANVEGYPGHIALTVCLRHLWARLAWLLSLLL